MSNDKNMNAAEQGSVPAVGGAKLHNRLAERSRRRHIPAGTSHDQCGQVDDWELRMKRLNPNWAPHRDSAADIG